MIKNLALVALVTMNLVFGWALYTHQASQPTTSPRGAERTLPVPVTKAVETSPLPKTGLTHQVATTFDAANFEPTFETGNYDALADQLREAGYSEDLVRQILLATMERDHLLSRSRELKPGYWQSRGSVPEATVEATLAWQAEKRLRLQQIFGDQIAADPLFESLFRPLNDTLPFLNSDKQVAIYELQEINRVKTEALFGTAYTQEARADRRALMQQLGERVSELLTRDELFEYQLRESRLAESMQRINGVFDYTEQEYRDIFTARQQFEGSNLENYTERAGNTDIRNASNQQVRDMLGESRFEEYQRARDPGYRSLTAIGERYGNSEAEINDVFKVATVMRDDIQYIRRQPNLTREERRAEIDKIRETSLAQIESIAGKDTADSVRQNGRRLGLGRGKF